MVRKTLTDRARGEAVKVFGVNPDSYVQAVDSSPPPPAEGEAIIALGEYASRYKLDAGRKAILKMAFGPGAFKSPADWKFIAACVAVKPEGVEVAEWVEMCRMDGIPCGLRDYAAAFVGPDAEPFLAAMNRGPLTSIEGRLMRLDKWDGVIKKYFKNPKIAADLKAVLKETAAGERVGLAPSKPASVAETKDVAAKETKKKEGETA